MKKIILTILICSFTLLGIKIMIRENVEKSFYGKIVEIGDAFLIVQPNEDEKEAEFSNRYLIDLQKDAEGYELGDIVKITYSRKKENNYPHNIIPIEVELQPVKQFKLKFHPNGRKSKNLILDKDKSSKYYYSIYTYNGDVDIVIENKTYSLESALKKDRITMEQIIDYAKKNCNDRRDYNDGGSTEYHLENFTILKLRKIDGNSDVYIGDNDFNIYELDL